MSFQIRRTDSNDPVNASGARLRTELNASKSSEAVYMVRGSFDEVVSFVHKQADAPFVSDCPTKQHCASVKVVVVVADNHITPAGKLLAQVVRADLVAGARPGERRPGQETRFRSPRRALLADDRRNPRARGQTRAVTWHTGVLAGLAACYELNERGVAKVAPTGWNRRRASSAS